MRFTLTVLVLAIGYAGLIVGAIFLDRANPGIHWAAYGIFFTGYNLGAALILDRATRLDLCK